MSRHNAPTLSAGQEIVEPLVWLVDAAYRAWSWLWGADYWERPSSVAVIRVLRFAILQVLFFLLLVTT
jgi:hypothetical protein